MALHPTLAAIKRNLPKVAKANGFQARVTSGYRTRAAQKKLYDRYLQGLQPYPVAKPGTSDHEKGLALDVVSTDTNKLVALLTDVGLFWAGPTDPVHFSMVVAPKASQAQKKEKVPKIPKKYKDQGMTERDWEWLQSLPEAERNWLMGKDTGLAKILWNATFGAAKSLLKYL